MTSAQFRIESKAIISVAIVSKNGYPTQKPLGVLERIVKVHSLPGDVVLDAFAGSGTTGEAAAKNGRGFLLIDASEDAVALMQKRLWDYSPAVNVTVTF